MNRLMTYGKRIRKDRRGFTLAEALIAVGILVILPALLIPNLVRIRKEMRQKEPDAKAELIHIAAQNELVKLRSEGNADAGIGEEIGTRDSAGLQTAMGSAFQTDTGDTLAYNLRDQGLTTYPYPRLTVSRHYGDWQASFRAGALVYYEKYRNADRTYGFYGANVKSTLTESGSVAVSATFYETMYGGTPDAGLPEDK